MLKYIAIPAVIAIVILFRPDLEAVANSSQQVRNPSAFLLVESVDQRGIGYCLAATPSDAPSAAPGHDKEAVSFADDYMTANGDFFSLKRFFACSSQVHRARVS